MASSGFVKFSETHVKSFSEDQENVNTKRKTSYDLKLVNDFLASEEERREIEEIPVAEPQALQKSGEFEQNSSVKRRRIIIGDSDESK